MLTLILWVYLSEPHNTRTVRHAGGSLRSQDDLGPVSHFDTGHKCDGSVTDWQKDGRTDRRTDGRAEFP